MCTELYTNHLHLKFSDLTTVGIDSVLIAGFLRLGTVEIWGQDIVCERAVPCSVRCLLAFLVYTNDIPAATPRSVVTNHRRLHYYHVSPGQRHVGTTVPSSEPVLF